MSTLLTSVGLFTYESYQKKFEQWVLSHATSLAISSPALVEYTKLDWVKNPTSS